MRFFVSFLCLFLLVGCCSLERCPIDLSQLSRESYTILLYTNGNEYFITKDPSARHPLTIQCRSYYFANDEEEERGFNDEKHADKVFPQADPVLDGFVEQLLRYGELRGKGQSYGGGLGTPSIVLIVRDDRFRNPSNGWPRYHYFNMLSFCYPAELKKLYVQLHEHVYGLMEDELRDVPVWFPGSENPPKEVEVVPCATPLVP